MKIASLDIPAFPSLTREESTAARNIYSGGKLRDKRTEFDVLSTTVTVDQTNIRRYTMKDIGTLDQRISNLEYYVSLNSLETDTFNKQFKNNSGIERFKNGIFVEPFISHQFGDTNNSEYRVSIDQDNGHFRPSFSEVLVDNFTPEIVSGNVEITGQRLMFKHSESALIKQDKATKVRPAAPVSIRFSGTVNLFPEYDAGTDTTNVGRIIVNPEEQPPVQEGTVTRFGNWRTIRSRRSRGRRWDSTTFTQSRNLSTVTTRVTENEETVGGQILDVSATPFIRELAIGFTATGLRPREQHSIFFNDVNVDEHVAPGSPLRSPIAVDPSIIRVPLPVLTGEDQRVATTATSSDQSSLMFRTSRRGDPLITNHNGSVGGVFFVPKDTFLQGDRNFLIADVQDLATETDSILSSASKMFYSNRIGVQRNELVERTFDVQREVVTSTQTRTTTQRRRVDPIAQTFYIRDDGKFEEDGVFVSSLDLFFRRKSSTNSIKVFICEIENGYPDTSRVYKSTEISKNPADVNVTNDASVATNFKFKYPVFLKKDRGYAFVVKPEADDPDYDVYFSQLGGADLTTGSAVNSQPYEGIAFIGANQDTWSAIQDEDIKFTLNKAVFETGAAQVRMIPRNVERGQFEDITFTNNNTSMRVGDFVYGMTSANTDPTLTVGNVNTSIFGVISSIDDINNVLTLAPTTGNFNNSSTKTFSTTLLNGSTKNTIKHKLAIYRPNDSLLDTEVLDINRFVGTTFTSLEDHEYSVIVPQFTTGVFRKSSIDFDYNYNISNTASVSFPIPTEGEYEYTNYPLVLRSRTNEKLKLGSATGNTSFFINVDMVNSTTKTSPFIDLRRTLHSAIGNLTITPDDSANNFINGTSVGTETSASIYSEIFSGLGESNVRYISQPITLADGQDAEDIRVLLSAFKPPRAKIYVFGRFVNQYDNLDEVLFTPLKDITPEVNSSRTDRDDIKEFEFRLFTRDELNATEWVKVFNDTTGSDYAFKYTNQYTANSLVATDTTTGIADYFRDGTTFKTYKQFQIKVVTYATVDSPAGYGTKNSSNPAIIEDLRAIALQV